VLALAQPTVGRIPVLSLNSRVHPQHAEIAAKVIDGEAIIINLTNGMYYSMDQAGSLIWTMVAQGCSLQELVSELTRRYDVSTAQAIADAERVVTELLEQKLVHLWDSEEAVPFEHEADSTSRLPYEPPVLNKYSDLGDLLALDPPMPGLDDIPWDGPPEPAAR
jgi:hypothetical protein